jgi:AcrR family transcriptional regulator
VGPSTEMERQTSCMYTLSAEINRARAEVMREISAIAVQLFEERGYDRVTMKDVAYEAGVSVATLYRRYSNKENLVVWNPDEQAEMDALRSALQSGTSLVGAARQMADHLPDDAAEAVEATARIRLHLIRAHPSLQAAARMKSESFVDACLEASGGHDDRPTLERETEARCVAAALDSGSHAWLRGEGTLRAYTLAAIDYAARETGTSGD